MERKNFAVVLALILILSQGIVFTGCSKNKDLDRVSREQAATIQSLNNEIQRLNTELEEAIKSRDALQQANAVAAKPAAATSAGGARRYIK